LFFFNFFTFVSLVKGYVPSVSHSKNTKKNTKSDRKLNSDNLKLIRAKNIFFNLFPMVLGGKVLKIIAFGPFNALFTGAGRCLMIESLKFKLLSFKIQMRKGVFIVNKL